MCSAVCNCLCQPGQVAACATRQAGPRARGGLITLPGLLIRTLSQTNSPPARSGLLLPSLLTLAPFGTTCSQKAPVILAENRFLLSLQFQAFLLSPACEESVWCLWVWEFVCVNVCVCEVSVRCMWECVCVRCMWECVCVRCVWGVCENVCVWGYVRMCVSMCVCVCEVSVRVCGICLGCEALCVWMCVCVCVCVCGVCENVCLSRVWEFVCVNVCEVSVRVCVV